jgi:hypothetical protein
VKLIKEFAKKWKNKKGSNVNRKLTVVFNGESVERFDRLRTKIARTNNQDLIAMALKALEQRTDSIIKRQAKQKARTLENEGFSLQQIAECLNNQGIPTVMENAKWRTEDVSRLLKKAGGQDFAQSIRK